MSVPEALSAKYEKTFAYYTVRDRLPDILTKTLDTFHREWKSWQSDCLPSDVDISLREPEAKAIIGQLSKLHYLMMTDKELEDLQYDSEEDFKVWKTAVEEEKAVQQTPLSWFTSRWLFVECYLYRRIADIFLYYGRNFQSYDPFETQKRSSLQDNMISIRAIGKFVTNPSATTKDWLELSLWGNRCDLSLSSTTPSFDNIVQQLQTLRSNILVNEIEVVLKRLESLKMDVGRKQTIDIVLDNSGFELFTDLCLMHCLTKCLPSLQTIRIHVKTYPWFVSDTMKKDFTWTIDYLIKDHDLQDLATEWSEWIKTGRWQIIENNFWTLSYDFHKMPDVCPDLYASLQDSSLIIFKGDLNYRKLLGDLNWPHDTPFEVTLRNFKPSFLVTLRTNKADLISGLNNESEKHLPDNFLVSGEFAVIQAFKGQ